MSDIELVIKIPEEAKRAFDCAKSNDLKAGYYDLGGVIGTAIKNGKPLPKGHWIHLKVGRLFPSNDFKCSECGNTLDFDGVNCGRGDANYCPNCGADMREKESE